MKKSEVILIYVTSFFNNKGYAEDKEVTKRVVCDVLKTWSVDYYDKQNRNMSKSLNLRIQRRYTEDSTLMYVIYNDKRYSIQNVLVDKDKGDRFCILDCDEERVG